MNTLVGVVKRNTQPQIADYKISSQILQGAIKRKAVQPLYNRALQTERQNYDEATLKKMSAPYRVDELKGAWTDKLGEMTIYNKPISKLKKYEVYHELLNINYDFSTLVKVKKGRPAKSNEDKQLNQEARQARKELNIAIKEQKKSEKEDSKRLKQAQKEARQARKLYGPSKKQLNQEARQNQMEMNKAVKAEERLMRKQARENAKRYKSLLPSKKQLKQEARQEKQVAKQVAKEQKKMEREQKKTEREQLKYTKNTERMMKREARENAKKYKVKAPKEPKPPKAPKEPKPPKEPKLPKAPKQSNADKIAMLEARKAKYAQARLMREQKRLAKEAKEAPKPNLQVGKPIERIAKTSTKAGNKLYDILNISPNATDEEIKKAYKKLSLKVHPDKNKTLEAKARFQELNQAVEILKDKFAREFYDKFKDRLSYNKLINDLNKIKIGN